MSELGGGGAFSTRGRLERPWVKGMVRCAMASMGSCFRIGGAGTRERQPRGRYTEDRPRVRCLEEYWALKVEREGKDGGSLAAAGLRVGEAQAIRRAARHLRYPQYASTSGRHTSRVRIELGVE